jgi:hypothetical protein
MNFRVKSIIIWGECDKKLAMSIPSLPTRREGDGIAEQSRHSRVARSGHIGQQRETALALIRPSRGSMKRANETENWIVLRSVLQAL